MFGPRLSYRNGSAWTPFAQALFGGVHASASADILGMKTPTKTENEFAFAVGGGLDVKVLDDVALRQIRAEYFSTQFNGGLAAKAAEININDQNDRVILSGLCFDWAGNSAAFKWGCAPLSPREAPGSQPDGMWSAPGRTYFDLETRVLEPLENPFGPKVLPMS